MEGGGPAEPFDDYLGTLRSAARELKAKLASRSEYASLYDAIGACHRVYDLLTSIRTALSSHGRDNEHDFLDKAVSIGLTQVEVAMSHGFEVYGQELDPLKFRLSVAVAIAEYTLDRLNGDSGSPQAGLQARGPR